MQEPGVIGKISLSLKVTIMAIVTIVFFSVTYLYVQFENYRPLLSFVSLLAGGMAAIYSAFYVGLTLRRNIERDKVQRALALGESIGSREMMEIRQFIEGEVNHKELSAKQMFDKIMENSSLLYAVRTVLNGMERVAVSVQKGDADEDAVYRYLCYSIPSVYKMYGAFIEEARRHYEDNKLWIEYERLVRAWAAGHFLSSGNSLPDVSL